MLQRLTSDGAVDPSFVSVAVREDNSGAVIAGDFADGRKLLLLSPRNLLSGRITEEGTFAAKVATIQSPRYVLEYKNSWNDIAWTEIDSTLGTGLAQELTDPRLEAQQRFYRVRVTP